MRALAGLTIVATALAVVTGCGDPAPTDGSNVPLLEPIVTCTGVPAANCVEAVRQIMSNGSDVPAALVRIQCIARACTERGGTASIEILYASGERTSSMYGWGMSAEPVAVEPPVLPVIPACIGVDQVHCRSMAESAMGGRPFPPPIRSITVTCVGVCGPMKGEGTTVITYADGTTDNGGWEYQGG